MSPEPRRLPVQEITTATDTRDVLALARRQAQERSLDEYFVVDVDSHHVETDSWLDILSYIEDPVLRYNATTMTTGAGVPAYLPAAGGMQFQDVFGRIPHQQKLAEAVPADAGVHRDVTLVRRAMESMGVDVQIVFPQAMLSIGLHPLVEAEVALTLAYNRWFTEHVLAADERIKGLISLPFGDPEACVRMVREFAGRPGVVGSPSPAPATSPCTTTPTCRSTA